MPSELDTSSLPPTLSGLGTKPAALRLPRVTRAHLRLEQIAGLAQRADELLAQAVGGIASALSSDLSARARLMPFARALPRQFPSTSFIAAFELAACEAPAFLESELDLAVALVAGLAARTPVSSPVTTLTRLEEATLGYLLLSALRPIRSAGDWAGRLSPRLASMGTGGAGSAFTSTDGRVHYVVIEVSIESGGARGDVRCWIPSSALLRVWADLEADTLESLPLWEVPLRCSLEPALLSRADFDSLVVRDVVLLGAQSASAAGRIRSTTFECRGAFTVEGFSLSQLRSFRNSPANAEETQMTDPFKSPDALRVELEVELTRKHLTLAQLASLKPGVIVPLQLSLSEPVLLRVGERIVGTAELVDVEGEVGARILTLIR